MISRRLVSLCLSLLTSIAAVAFGKDPTRIVARQYSIDIQMFSMNPREGLESYRGYGGGGGGPRASLGLSAIDDRRFSLTVETMVRSKEFIARVVVEPDPSDPKTKPMDREFVLSDLSPQSIEIARGDDGRIYRVQLYPRIEELPKPRMLDADALRLNEFSFESCPVILNDQTYIGRLAMSSGELVSLNLPGLAFVEFSLIPFRGAEPLGTLKDGAVNVIHESGTSLQITDVKNGVHRKLLDGGPYQVFVRWSKPSMTMAEYHAQLEETIANVKKQMESGDIPDGQNVLKRLEHAKSSKDLVMISSGLGPIPAEDRVTQGTQ